MDTPTTVPQQTGFTTAMVIDDHPLFCDALSMTLNSVLAIAEVRSAETLGMALEQLAKSDDKPDVIFLDLNLPDVNGLDGLLRLKAAAPGIPLIVVSSMVEPQVVNACIRTGARGYIPKNSKRDTFREAFDTIRQGGVYTPDQMFISDQGSQADDVLARLGELTKQQACILGLICEGKLNKQIAYDLSIAETTVKAHVTAIMRKLRVQSRTQAVLVAQEARFASLARGEEPPQGT